MEQFLGPVGAPDRPGISYVEVRPAKTSYEVYVHALEDIGHERFFDLVEFPPLDTDEDEAECGQLVATAEDPSAALVAAEEVTGAVRERWVNESWSRTNTATSFWRAVLWTNLPMDTPGRTSADHQTR